MSYIFEALKKLEQKRQREGASRLLMVTGEVAPERKRWPSWPLPVLATLLLLNAGVMIWWIRPWTRHQQPAPTQPPAVQVGASVAPVAIPPRVEEQDRSRDAKEVPELKTASRSAAPVARKEDSDISRTKHAPATRPTNPEPQVRSESRVVAAGRVLDLKELPPAIRSSLPDLKISAHYYTVERQSRFTKINEQTLREGQVFAPGVKLEEITPDGVVLGFQGYRFQMGINEGR
jgi:general secretion pathway protein B